MRGPLGTSLVMMELTLLLIKLLKLQLGKQGNLLSLGQFSQDDLTSAKRFISYLSYFSGVKCDFILVFHSLSFPENEYFSI